MKKYKADLTLLTLFIVISIYALSIIKFQHVRVTADSMLYFSISKKYLSGDFVNAVNGYWGPLLAWLLVPFLSLGFSDIAALNMVNLAVGIITFVSLWRLSYRFEMSDGIRGIVLIASLPVILKTSLVQPMDFLLLCVLILYVNIVLQEDYGSRLLHGVSSGIFGAFAYLTKAFYSALCHY